MHVHTYHLDSFIVILPAHFDIAWIHTFGPNEKYPLEYTSDPKCQVDAILILQRERNHLKIGKG